MKHILVVEDDLDTIEIVELILKDECYKVTKITDVVTVLHIADLSPDLVIVDFMLSFGLGDDLCLDIKNHEATKHIPVILYSASPYLEKIVSRCKADAFIAKPFDLDHFLSVIYELTNREN